MPPEFSRPRLDPPEYGLYETLRGFHLGGIRGVRFAQARRVRRPRIMGRWLRQMQLLLHIGVAQEHASEACSMLFLPGQGIRPPSWVHCE